MGSTKTGTRSPSRRSQAMEAMTRAIRRPKARRRTTTKRRRWETTTTSLTSMRGPQRLLANNMG